jgi:alginate O-acetyltransferase complex protein AlgI
MLLGLLGGIVLAPVFWLVVPERWRGDAIAVLSLLGLGLYDPRLPPLLLGVALALAALIREISAQRGLTRSALTVTGLAALATFFLWNKRGGGMSTLPSQSGLVFLGVSFLVLKAAAALIDTARGSAGSVRWRELLAWLAFLPTYPSGPMEELDHFRRQEPRLDGVRALGGLERILFGLVKALLLAHYLGVWSDPIIAAPDTHSRATLLAALYALSLRFYFDFAGYSDIAIGLGALYGYDIEENFDNPLIRRNLTQLWQRWHMTLTRWLRAYLFIPVSRRLMRLGLDRSAVAAGQIVAMTFCGLWHGLGPGFLLWGFLQGLGLIWVGVVCRDLGRLLPAPLVGWWRRSPLAYGVSTALTFTTFSLLMILLVTDVGRALGYVGYLVWPR